MVTPPGRPTPALVGDGTPEGVWRAWSAPRTWPVLDLVDMATVVVVAPHPDDETLGVGGLMVLLRRAGTPVMVVAVTDGDASHPHSPTLTPTELVCRRVDERRAALRELGLADVPVRRLSVPDGAVAEYVDQVVGSLTELVEELDGLVCCLSTYAADGHPDHDAVGVATARACAVTGASHYEYPVWTWHWAVPDDPRVPWHRAARVPLPRDVLAAKRRAAACFRTQVAPLSDQPGDEAVVPPAVLARLLRDRETVFRPEPAAA